MSDLATAIILTFIGVTITAGVGFTIWLIQQHITDSTAMGTDLKAKVTQLGTDLDVHAATEEADLGYIRTKLDEHIGENRSAHEAINERLDRHLDGT